MPLLDDEWCGAAGNLKRIYFTVPHDKECQAGVKDQRRKNCADGVPSKCRYYHGGSGVKDKCLLAFCGSKEDGPYHGADHECCEHFDDLECAPAPATCLPPLFDRDAL